MLWLLEAITFVYISTYDLYVYQLHLWKQILLIMARDEQTFEKFGSTGSQVFGKKFRLELVRSEPKFYQMRNAPISTDVCIVHEM